MICRDGCKIGQSHDQSDFMMVSAAFVKQTNGGPIVKISNQGPKPSFMGQL